MDPDDERITFDDFEDEDRDETGPLSPEDGPRGTTEATPSPTTQELVRLLALTRKDLREAARSIGLNEARYLVDSYYSWQGYRIASANQVRALGAGDEPADAIKWLQAQMLVMEDNIRAMLDVWTKHEATGLAWWARRHVGVGAVIAAGLRAHLDIGRARTVGHWWRFAGFDPSNEWLGREKAETLVREIYEGLRASGPPGNDVLAMASQRTHRPLATIERLSLNKQGVPTREALVSGLARRPWNANLKVLLWKLGESFVKQSGHKDGFFGKVYIERKLYEQDKNERGLLADQAREKIQRFNIGDDTDAHYWYTACLTAGAAREILTALPGERQALTRRLAGKPGTGVAMLPPAHIHARAKRYAVKLFLSMYHEEAWRRQYGTLPPVPYAIAHLGHAHGVTCPVPFTPVPNEGNRTPIDPGQHRPPNSP